MMHMVQGRQYSVFPENFNVYTPPVCTKFKGFQTYANYRLTFARSSGKGRHMLIT